MLYESEYFLKHLFSIVFIIIQIIVIITWYFYKLWLLSLCTVTQYIFHYVGLMLGSQWLFPIYPLWRWMWILSIINNPS